MHRLPELVAPLPQKLREVIMRVLILLFLCAVGFVSTGSDIKDFYETPTVKKLGIKKPPKNRLKTELSRPASEQELAAFLNKQASRHADQVSKVLDLKPILTPKSLSELVSKLNEIATSLGWKRLANSNIRHVFHADVKKHRDEIYYGLCSVENKLNELEYESKQTVTIKVDTTTVKYDFRTNFHIINCPKCQAAGRVPVMTDEMFKQMEKIHKGFSPSLSKKQRNDNRRMRIFLNEHSPDDNTFYDKNGNAYDIGSCPDLDL